jgi:hypothetical protein
MCCIARTKDRKLRQSGKRSTGKVQKENKKKIPRPDESNRRRVCHCVGIRNLKNEGVPDSVGLFCQRERERGGGEESLVSRAIPGGPAV